MHIRYKIHKDFEKIACPHCNHELNPKIFSKDESIDIIELSSLDCWYQENCKVTSDDYLEILSHAEKILDFFYTDGPEKDLTFLAKYPVIYKTLCNDQSLRWPLIYADSQNGTKNTITAGGGRIFVIYNFFKDMLVDKLVYSNQSLINGEKITNIDRLNQKIFTRSRYLRNSINNVKYDRAQYNQVAGADWPEFDYIANGKLTKQHHLYDEIMSWESSFKKDCDIIWSVNEQYYITGCTYGTENNVFSKNNILENQKFVDTLLEIVYDTKNQSTEKTLLELCAVEVPYENL